MEVATTARKLKGWRAERARSGALQALTSAAQIPASATALRFALRMYAGHSERTGVRKGGG